MNKKKLQFDFNVKNFIELQIASFYFIPFMTWN